MENHKDSRTRREEVRIVDRRFFTPDGEARDPGAARDEQDAAPDERRTASTNPDIHSELHAGRGDGSAAVPQPGGILHGAGRTPETARTSQDDPAAAAHFKNLILNLATSAAANLGEIPNPYSQQTEVDLEGARQLIDLLQALKVKTRGNLNQEELSLLDNLLYDLQVKFVSLQSTTPKKP